MKLIGQFSAAVADRKKSDGQQIVQIFPEISHADDSKAHPKTKTLLLSAIMHNISNKSWLLLLVSAKVYEVQND
jgi:hypothetical protein